MTVDRGTSKDVKISAVFDSISTQVCVVNSEGLVLDSNSAWKIFSADNKDSAPYYLWETLHSYQVSPIVIESLKQSIQTIRTGREQLFTLDYRAKRNEQTVWYSIRIHAVPSTDFFAVTQVDISPRKHLEAQLRESEQNYHSLFNVMQEGLIGFTKKGTITLVNQGFLNLISENEDALIGQHISKFFPDANHFLNDNELAIESFEFEEHYKFSNDHSYYLHVTLFPDPHNKNQYFALIRDVSFYKQVQLNQTIAIRLANKISSDGLDLRQYLTELKKEVNRNFRDVRVNYRSTDGKTIQVDDEDTDPIEDSVESVMATEIILTNKSNSFSTKDLNKRGVKRLPEGFFWVGAPVFRQGKVCGVLLLKYGVGQIYSDEPTIQFVSTLAQQMTSLIAQNVLHEDKERVFINSHDLICVLKEDRFLMVINPAFERTLGYTRDELRAHRIEHYVHPEDHYDLNLAFEELRKGNSINNLVLRFKTKDGESKRISWNATSDEQRLSLYCIGRDVSEELNAIDQVRESEAQYRGIFERINEGLLFLDKTGTIQSVNPGMCRMINSEPKELVNKNAIDLIDNETQRMKLQAIIDKGNSSQYNSFDTTLRVGNTKKELQISVYPRQLDGNLSQGLMVVVTDISQLRKLEDIRMTEQKLFSNRLEQEVLLRTSELERAKNELAISLEKEKEMGELKSRFVATASHQFRTPLSVIQSNIGILEMQQGLMSPEFQQKFLKANTRIKDQITKMTNMMNDVLILGKISAGSIPNRPIPTSIRKLIEKIIRIYNNIDKKQRINLTVVGKEQLWQIDPSILEHAISNLISNAVKYSPGDSPIHVRIEGSKNQINIHISDTGIGIPETELTHIFEPFYRASNALDISGTGLGMGITKEYIELIGGHISVKSQIQKGSTFTITLK